MYEGHFLWRQDLTFLGGEACVKERELQKPEQQHVIINALGLASVAGPFCEEMNCFILPKQCLCFYL